jgi:Na+-transporting methylmalonyl-CoA/oxaloacetate decarboxylase gamma subunit
MGGVGRWWEEEEVGTGNTTGRAAGSSSSAAAAREQREKKQPILVMVLEVLLVMVMVTVLVLVLGRRFSQQVIRMGDTIEEEEERQLNEKRENVLATVAAQTAYNRTEDPWRKYDYSLHSLAMRGSS